MVHGRAGSAATAPHYLYDESVYRRIAKSTRGLHRVQVSVDVHHCGPAGHLAKLGLERVGGAVEATRHLGYGYDRGCCDALQKLLTVI